MYIEDIFFITRPVVIIFKDFFAKNIPNMKYLEPDTAPYIFIKVNGCDKEFAKNAAAKGVVVIPGSAFGESGTGWIRISYALNRELLQKGLEILAEIM